MKILSTAKIFSKIPTDVMSAIVRIAESGVVPSDSDVVCCEHPQTQVVASNLHGELFWFFLCDDCLANSENQSFTSFRSRLPITLIAGTPVLLANVCSELAPIDLGDRSATRVRLLQ